MSIPLPAPVAVTVLNVTEKVPGTKGVPLITPVVELNESPGGRPVAGAVVMIDSAVRDASVPIRFPWPYVVAQAKIAFDPHVLIVPVGASVAFPNRDQVRHHVYSFSKPKKFELKLYGREQARSVVFDKPGIVALGCNIHDSMSGFVVVVDTPFAMQTDATGHARIANVPAGAAHLRIWHPSIRAPNNQVIVPVAVSGATFAKAITPAGL